MCGCIESEPGPSGFYLGQWDEATYVVTPRSVDLPLHSLWSTYVPVSEKRGPCEKIETDIVCT